MFYNVRLLATTIIMSIMSVVICSNTSLADDPVPGKEDIAKWRVQAANNDPEAQFNLGEAYLKGEVVKKDEKEAAKWYYRAAMQGYPDAQFAMGFVYRGGGGGVPMDKVLSYMWFDLAAKNGDYRAFELRNDVAWSMTEAEIDEARKKSRQWEPDKTLH